ncbi:NUDIX domain-containing protein [Aquimarina sp. U1-2]|uniref:NUDIX hydrolase n=1 Tax=Aquimarina sp. U1-2 TaxID=2823141 RepID=UPI001AECA961|nr:NUDIX domain-containing protein [Aquimarina sp. U1-2]MBP2833949.1 NUDIX domain-containing protein [Aquimarina sp. U1-2]
MIDELIDIVDKTGKPTGEKRLKSEAHALGLYHASVHIWFYTADQKVLFQKRAANKDVFPNLWDVSVAGHVGTGELPIHSAIREIEEEIGLKITEDDLEFISIYLAKKIPKPNIIDNEFHHIYFSKLTTPVQELQLQTEEVSKVKLFEIDILKDIIEHPKNYNNFVTHDLDYYQLIFDHVQNRMRSKS